MFARKETILHRKIREISERINTKEFSSFQSSLCSVLTKNYYQKSPEIPSKLYYKSPAWNVKKLRRKKIEEKSGFLTSFELKKCLSAKDLCRGKI